MSLCAKVVDIMREIPFFILKKSKPRLWSNDHGTSSAKTSPALVVVIDITCRFTHAEKGVQKALEAPDSSPNGTVPG